MNENKAILDEITKMATEGVMFLHHNEYVHKDLKPQNVLLRREGDKIVCKLGDFGLSKEIMKGQSHCDVTNRPGTMNWTAPEVTNSEWSGQYSQPFSKKSDIWSLGCVIFFIFTKRHPFGDLKKGTEIEERVKSCGLPLESCMTMLANMNQRPLIEKMIQRDANDRPDIEEVLKHLQTN